MIDTRTTISVAGKEYVVYSLPALAKSHGADLNRLPYSIRVILEAALRRCDGKNITEQQVLDLLYWKSQDPQRPAISFYPGRVLMQDFSGVPVLNDLAGLRAAVARMGGDPEGVQPLIPVDLVVDHSLQVDFAGVPDALRRNVELDYQRNGERYAFLRWSQQAFSNLRVVPPSSGIIHQVNIEHLASLVLLQAIEGESLLIAFPDSLLGTDSHTTMVNGIGVTGWGVGGIEAVAAMLGEPIEMLIPDVIGFRLTGRLMEGVTPTDLTLTITQMLRKKGVVEKFVEYFGPGVSSLSAADRVMVANMTPETGATMGFFPVDQQALDYLILTGRSSQQIELVSSYYRTQGMFREEGIPDPQYTDILELDLSSVEPSLAGPKRPQDRVPLKAMKQTFHKALTQPTAERGYALQGSDLDRSSPVEGMDARLRHGAVIIAAITSCTNTSNPFVMMSAGILAKKAVEKGLQVPAYVKCSLTPGSLVVAAYLKKAGLMEPLAKLGFEIAGYGCATCIGNSGPIAEPLVKAIEEGKIVAASVLSGNRNFEGRVHPQARANYLASPPLVVAYAIAGTVDIDLTQEPLGTGMDGQPIYLRDIYPTSQEVLQISESLLGPELFREAYRGIFTENETWNQIPAGTGKLYAWDQDSTYLQEPPFLVGLPASPPEVRDIHGARVLAKLGDSVTTDHISPAGNISPKSPAGQYLLAHGVAIADFNAYGARRGNDQVMTRGTFANVRLRNLLLNGVEGGFTLHLPQETQMPIYDAAMKYKEEGTALIIIAGKEYGTGSSRDWAAKGALLLGVRAVLAESFERIHRSNLVEMGVLPLQFLPGENAASLGLSGKEVYSIEGLQQGIAPAMKVHVTARGDLGEKRFTMLARIDTPGEAEYYKNGGVLQTVLYKKDLK